MSREYRCDECDDPVTDPLALTYHVADDDTDDCTDEEAHFCSYGCVAAWAMTASLEYETNA